MGQSQQKRKTHTGDEKKLYVGDFRYNRELVTKHVFAFSGRQAKVLMMKQLAEDHGVNYSIVAGIFDGSKPNFDIKVDTKWREKHDKMQDMR